MAEWTKEGISALYEQAIKDIDSLRAENERLRGHLSTIRDAIIHRRSVSGHIDYQSLRDYIDKALTQ